MPAYKLYLLLNGELTYFADAEASNAAEAKLSPHLCGTNPDTLVALEFDPDAMPLIAPQIPPSGRYCIGMTFDVADDAAGAAIVASYRRCGWDGELGQVQNNGEYCSVCNRLIKDGEHSGIAYSEPVNARYVYLERFKIWQLVQVP